MKRFIVAAAFFLMSLCFGEKLFADNFGVVAGANFSTAHIKEIGTESQTQWHFGFAYKFDLPLGFQFQPTLLYNVKGTELDLADVDLSVGYLELMTSVQWGLDLILFRPFLDVSPFIGYGINSMGDLKALWKEGGNRLEYGLGLGGGLQVWKFQLAARYNWNFGGIMKDSGSGKSLNDAKFRGVTLSLAYFF